MHPEVTKLLDTLQEKEIPMGIITNGPTDHQFHIKYVQVPYKIDYRLNQKFPFQVFENPYFEK
jgi:hypothetical protein